MAGEPRSICHKSKGDIYSLGFSFILGYVWSVLQRYWNEPFLVRPRRVERSWAENQRMWRYVKSPGTLLIQGYLQGFRCNVSSVHLGNAFHSHDPHKTVSFKMHHLVFRSHDQKYLSFRTFLGLLYLGSCLANWSVVASSNSLTPSAL